MHILQRSFFFKGKPYGQESIHIFHLEKIWSLSECLQHSSIYSSWSRNSLRFALPLLPSDQASNSQSYEKEGSLASSPIYSIVFPVWLLQAWCRNGLQVEICRNMMKAYLIWLRPRRRTRELDVSASSLSEKEETSVAVWGRGDKKEEQQKD